MTGSIQPVRAHLHTPAHVLCRLFVPGLFALFILVKAEPRSANQANTGDNRHQAGAFAFYLFMYVAELSN